MSTVENLNQADFERALDDPGIMVVAPPPKASPPLSSPREQIEREGGLRGMALQSQAQRQTRTDDPFPTFASWLWPSPSRGCGTPPGSGPPCSW
jgi:hypothetical protein